MLEMFKDLKTVNDASIVIRLLLAVVCGGVIGIERGRAGRPAGFRTHILVCLGSTLAILTNQYILQEYGVSDPSRIGAQVISGIGFLGAGTIIVTGKHQVKGLTTAATLWATACMGLAIGIGFYKGAILTCSLIWFVTVVLHRLDNNILSKSKVLDMYIEFKDSSSINTVLDAIKANMITIDAIEIIKPSYDNNAGLAAIVTLRLKQKRAKYDIAARICAIEGVVLAEEI